MDHLCYALDCCKLHPKLILTVLMKYFRFMALIILAWIFWILLVPWGEKPSYTTMLPPPNWRYVKFCLGLVLRCSFLPVIYRLLQMFYSKLQTSFNMSFFSNGIFLESSWVDTAALERIAYCFLCEDGTHCFRVFLVQCPLALWLLFWVTFWKPGQKSCSE